MKWEAKVRVKETALTWSQNLISSVTLTSNSKAILHCLALRDGAGPCRYFSWQLASCWLNGSWARCSAQPPSGETGFQPPRICTQPHALCTGDLHHPQKKVLHSLGPGTLSCSMVSPYSPWTGPVKAISHLIHQLWATATPLPTRCESNLEERTPSTLVPSSQVLFQPSGFFRVLSYSFSPDGQEAPVGLL